MKKIIFIIILLLTLTSAKASTNDTRVEIKWIPNVYYNYKIGNTIHWGQLGYIYANNTISYCYDIAKTITTDVYSSDDYVSLAGNGLLVAFFGYGYNDNNTLEDYMATQELIWKSQGITTYFTTSSEGKGSIIDVSENKNKILNLARSFPTFPTFEDLFIFDLGTTNKIKDTTNIINNYKITNISENIIKTEDNSLVIETYIPGTYSFNLTTQYATRFQNKKFTANNSQTIIQIGMINNMYQTYSYKVSSGDLTINLYDKITNSIENTGSTTFKGNIFKLYDLSNKLLGTYESLEDGKIFIDNLKLGKYRLEHLNISEGYKHGKTIYEFELVFNDTHKVIDIYLNPKSININIKKTYGNPLVGTIYNDDNVEFIVNDKDGNKIKELLTNDLGEVSTTLNYGTYLISQTTTNNIDKLANDYTIDTIDFDKNHNIIINDTKYTAKLNVCLYESGTIPIENTKFTINNIEYITNSEGCFITDYFEEKVIISEEVKEDYYKIDDIEVIIDENSKYYLDNNEVYIDVIIYNEPIPKKEPILVLDEIKEEPLVIKEIPIKNIKLVTTANEEYIKNEENIVKLPNLGIYDTRFLYIGILLFRYKRVKKNNT